MFVDYRRPSMDYDKLVDSGMSFKEASDWYLQKENRVCIMQNAMHNLLLLIIYVDDILIASIDLKWIHEIKIKLQEEFEIKDL